MALLEASGIGKNFGETHVLKDISLDLEQGEALAIIGSSGSGKTTLLRCLNFLERPDTGVIKVNGETMWDAADPATQKESEIRKKRLHFGLVFQNFNLFPHYTVLKNITDAPLSVQKRPKDQVMAQAHELLAKMGLEGKENMVPCELSGGQQQRVAIARALATQPKVLLCDEATSALDTRTTASILQLLQDINRELGVTLVVITHSLPVACKICNRVAVIDHGRIVEEGATAAVFGNPQSPVTRELLANDDMLAAIERDAEKGQEG